jgi:hypothetical protein
MTTVLTTPMSDAEVIKSFPRFEGPGISGYVIDFLGVKTRISYIRELAHDGGVVEGYPIPANFHATAIEWAGCLRAVLDADQEIVGVELGAGWGPWLVTLARAAQLRGIERIRLLGVEGSEVNCRYMASHFTDNGIDPKSHTLLHGVVGTRDGIAEFPLQEGFGSRAIFKADRDPAIYPSAASGSSLRQSYRALRKAARALFLKPAPHSHIAKVKLKAFSLATLLKPFSTVDLVHVDIQGDECTVLSRAQDVLKEKAKRLVIGTHGRMIEEKLLNCLALNSWILESEESCQLKQLDKAIVLLRDGCQVWRNSRVFLKNVRSS